jgi:hypothetical protein
MPRVMPGPGPTRPLSAPPAAHGMPARRTTAAPAPKTHAPTLLDGEPVDLSSYRSDPESRAKAMKYLLDAPTGADAVAWVRDLALIARREYPPMAGIPIEELTVLAAYISDKFIPMNQALRAREAGPKGPLAAAIKVASSGLAQLPAHQGTVYRAVGGLAPRWLDAYRPGEIVTERAFTSTTPNRGATYRFGKALLVIEAKRSGKQIWPLAGNMNRGEQEVLFPPGTRFVVRARTHDPKTRALVIELTEVVE